jgi:hypothetical protein
MERTLDEALAAVFGEAPPESPMPPDSAVPGDVVGLLQQVKEHLNKLSEYAADGDWTAWGEEYQALQELQSEIDKILQSVEQ